MLLLLGERIKEHNVYAPILSGMDWNSFLCLKKVLLCLDLEYFTLFPAWQHLFFSEIIIGDFFFCNCKSFIFCYLHIFHWYKLITQITKDIRIRVNRFWKKCELLFKNFRCSTSSTWSFIWKSIRLFFRDYKNNLFALQKVEKIKIENLNDHNAISWR